MCGRYACAINSVGRWGAIFSIWLEELVPRYNIAPGAKVPVFTKNGWVVMRWGLVPDWSREPKSKYATFNARSESLMDKPAYRGAWKNGHRCLIPLSGYYEWQGEKGIKKVYYLTSALDEPLFAAGLWGRWRSEDQEIHSCTIITSKAIENIQAIHNRMPLFIEPAQADCWLKSDLASALFLLQKPGEVELSWHEVDAKVGNTRNQGKELIVPLAPD